MSDNDLIRRGDALVKARPFCESQGDEWDRGYNTAISHYQVALLALTAAPAAEELANAHGIAQACERRAEAAEAKMDRLAGAVEDVINGITLLDDYRNALTAALAGEK